MEVDYSLYLATDPGLLAGRNLCRTIEEALKNGVTAVQLRNKAASRREIYDQADALHSLTAKYGLPLIINDHLDVMLAVDAEGIHLGPEDLPATVARQLAPHKIVGCSVNTMQDLEQAEKASADYIGIGPVFPTSTKEKMRTVLGIRGLKELVASTDLPSVAIGGISLENLLAVMGTGAAGVCVISGILSHPDTGKIVREFRKSQRTAALGHAIDAAGVNEGQVARIHAPRNRAPNDSEGTCLPLSP